MQSVGCTKFDTYFPSDELMPYVQYYSVFEISGIEDNAFIDEVVPLNLSAITFISDGDIYHYREIDEPFRTLFPVSVIGHIRKKAYSKFVGSGSGVLVIFTSYGLFRLFGINMNGLENTVKDATHFINIKEITECRQKLFEANAAEEKIRIVEKYLLDNLHKTSSDLRSINNIIDFINQQKGKIDIEWLCRQANMSFKTFERHFNQKIGISPKPYAEIVRFSNAFKMLKSNKNIFEIIAACGYTDQAHMIKEFKKFTGNTPKHYCSDMQNLSDYFMDLSVQE